MRNSFVVLISLCVVVTSGFVAPTGIPGLADDGIPKLSKTKRKLQPLESVNNRIKTDNDGRGNLDKNNNIGEKELFEDPIAKKNNINERSFVLLKQKYKTPVVNRLYSSQLQNLNKPEKAIENVSVNTKSGCGQRPQKQKIVENKETVVSHFVPLAYKYNSDRNVKNIIKEKKIQLEERLVSDQRQYLELLKPPLLRPLNKESHKTVFNTVDNSDPLLTNIDYLKYNQKQQSNKNQKQSKLPAVTKQQIQEQIKKYSYGFPSPYQVQRSVFRNNELSMNPEDTHSEGSFANANAANLSPLDVNGDDEQLDPFIKDTLEEQGIHERNNNEPNKCINCYLKDISENFNDIKHDRPNYNCEPNMQSRGNIIDSTVRERGGESKTTVVPNLFVMNEYEEIMPDKSNPARVTNEDNISTIIDKMNYKISI